MEKDKSRGIKHVKDKRKYKGNTTKNPKYVPAKSRPKLGSNWDRYEVPEESEQEHKLSSSTDFGLLANAPISAGSHFQFKSDRVLEDVTTEKDDELFALNLELLHKSILTIPFYERVDIPRKYFQDDDLKKMSQETSKNILSYCAFLDAISLNNEDKLPEKLKANVLIHEENLNQKNDDILELIGNCTINEELQGFQATVNDSVQTKHDLEQWLDDILGN